VRMVRRYLSRHAVGSIFEGKPSNQPCNRRIAALQCGLTLARLGIIRNNARFASLTLTKGLPMLAMQYSIQLPQNYDDNLILQRVEQRRSAFDGLYGMEHKAFLYNRDDKLYAPFYVWENLQQARDFLLDELFQGVIQSFNRPRVRDWVVLEQSYGNRALEPQFALREVDRIPPEEDLPRLLKQEQRNQQELLADPNLYYHLVAFDPDRWELVRYHLWRDRDSAAKAASGDCVQSYDVLHVTKPRMPKAA